MEAYDWDSHPLGNPAGWPNSLQTGIRMMLGSGFPMFIWWSGEFYMFHNDPYLPALGNKHPEALGASARYMWKEIWNHLGVIAEGILDGSNQRFYAKELLVLLNRSGFIEETYWTFSYSPLPNDDNSVGGVFCACSEVTDEVLAQRRLNTVREVTGAITQSLSVDEVSQQVCELMTLNADDVPFCLFYLLNSEGTAADLRGSAGEISTTTAPPVVALEAAAADVLVYRNKVESFRRCLKSLPAGSWEHATDQAVVVPVYQPGENMLLGFLVLGTSHRLPYDEAYQRFHLMLADQVSSTVSSIRFRLGTEASEQRLLQLANSIPHLILTARSNGEVDYGNQQWYAYTGFTVAETLGWGWVDAIHPEDAPLARTKWEQAGTNGENISLEYRLRQAKGSYRWHRVLAVADEYADGTPKKWYGTITDIHDQKLAEAELQRSKAQEQAAYAAVELQRTHLEKLFMQAPAAISILSGPDFVFELVNPGYQQLFPGRPLLGLPILEALPEISSQPIWTILKNVYQTGESYIGSEVRLMLARYDNGQLEENYFNFVYQPRYDQPGQVDGIFVFAYEVTDMVEARHKVESSEEHLRIALEAGNMATFNFDLLTNQTTRSANHDKLFGYESELLEWNMDALFKHILPEDHPKVQEQFEKSLKSGQLFLSPRIRRKDGELRWIEGLGKVMYNELRQPVRIAGVVTDVTARRQAEQMLQDLTDKLAAANTSIKARNKELAVTNEQLTRINADLDNFVYTASHDLRSPINSMEGLLIVLQEQLKDRLGEEDHLLMQHLTASMQKLNHTIQDLSEIVKVQKDTDLPLDVVSVQEVLADVLTDIKAQTAALDATIAYELEVPSLDFPKKYLRSILYNLLSNALNYRHPGRTPHVLVRTARKEQQVQLSVSDNGLGLNSRQVKKLFGMFQRMHPNTEGSGIGLYTIKRVIENYGGRITVDSKEGAGTTFYVYFPSAST